MSINFLIMALLICLFDLVILLLNYTKLKFRTPFTIWRALAGIIIALAIILLTINSGQTDSNRQMVMMAIALTALTWGLLRKGIGEKYVLVSLSVNGLMDWRNIRSIKVESSTNSHLVKVTTTDFLKRSRILKLQGEVEEIRAFATNKIKQNQL